MLVNFLNYFLKSMEIKNKQNEIKPLKILFIIDSLRAGGKERGCRAFENIIKF